MPGDKLADDQLLDLLQHYLTILQGHPTAEEMMDQVLTDDFETGFIGGHVWKGLEGLRDFLSQREGFFDEKHTIDELSPGAVFTAGGCAMWTAIGGSRRRWWSALRT
jgi:hypothetical protein